ncbi:hypothetical protein [Metabacillus sp. SLBN-84]
MPRHKKRPTRYRYITNGVVVGTDPISDFRLIAGSNLSKPYHGATALRVQIPRDLKLTKETCDPYSTTDDDRTLEELGYDFMIRDNTKGIWVARNEFKGTRPCDVDLYVAREALKKKAVRTS